MNKIGISLNKVITKNQIPQNTIYNRIYMGVQEEIRTPIQQAVITLGKTLENSINPEGKVVKFMTRMFQKLDNIIEKAKNNL